MFIFTTLYRPSLKQSRGVLLAACVWLLHSSAGVACAAEAQSALFQTTRFKDHIALVGQLNGVEILNCRVEVVSVSDKSTLESNWLERINIQHLSNFVIELSLDGNSELLHVVGSIIGGDLFPCTPNMIRGKTEIVRAVSGLSHSNLNTGVYCRDGDWAVVVSDATSRKIVPVNAGEVGLRCSVSASGSKVRIEILPQLYQVDRGLTYFEPKQYTLPAQVPSGWISWKAYQGAVSQDHIEQTADWAAENLRDFGLEYLIIDDGWFVGSNRGMLHSVPANVDWTRSNDGFPSGMQHLTRYVHDRGLKIGLWLTPFGCSNEQLQKEHPDWWVHASQNGEILQSSWHGKAFVDASNPDAISEWLIKGIRAQANSGFDYFKIDGQKHVAYDAYEKSEDYFSDKQLSWQEVLRQGWNAIRRVAGDRYVLACWGRVPEIAGYPLAIRIGGDKDSSWKSIVGAATDLANWFYEHNIVWCADPDHLVFEKLNLAECRTWATLLGLTGTHLTFSDKIEVYTPEKLEVLRRILPPIQTPSTRPVALYPIDKAPALWTLEIQRPFDNWLIVANSSVAEPVDEIHFDEIGLENDKEYAVFDFWQGQFCGVFRDSFPCGKPNAKETQVFSVREVRPYPWVISTNRHISQGGVDLLDVAWDPKELTLSGTSKVVAGDPYVLALQVPKGFAIEKGECEGREMVLSEQEGFATLTSIPIDNETVPWKIHCTMVKNVER